VLHRGRLITLRFGSMSLIGFRRRVPLVAGLLLVLACLMAVGVVCTCSSDHSLQSIQHVIKAGSAAAAMVVVFVPSFAVFVSGLVLTLVLVMPEARGRASPQVLQRFLF